MSGNEYRLGGDVIKGSNSFEKHESAFISFNRFGITGLADNLLPETRRVICYPNPTQGKIHLRAEGFLPEGTRIEVTDALGRRLMTTLMDAEQVTMDLSGNASGIYYIRITNDHWYQTERVVLRLRD